MNDRQKGYDLKLAEMWKELAGAQTAANNRVAEARAKFDHEIEKHKVSIQSSK